MLLELTIENYLSFNQAITASFLATRERQHGFHLSEYNIGSFKRKKVVPVAVMFGGNASGKSNFFRALVFAKQKVTVSNEKVSRIAFKLNEDCLKKPSKLGFKLLAGGNEYSYSFEVSDDAIISEELSLSNPKGKEILFSRAIGKDTFFGKCLSEVEPLRVIDKQLVKGDQLLLNAVALTKILEKESHLKNVFNWFKETLIPIYPDVPCQIHLRGDAWSDLGQMMAHLDTGISSIDKKEIPYAELSRQEPKIDQVLDATDGGTLRISRQYGQMPTEYFSLAKENGIKKSYQIIPHHKDSENKNVEFSFAEESEGTRRLLEILPVFAYSTKSLKDKVFVFDEADKGIHPLLMEKVISDFLEERSPKSRNQILMSAHSSNLMTQRIFRRDEIYLCCRNQDGSSEITRMSDFAVRRDEDLTRQYLKSVFGGTPDLAQFNIFDFARSHSWDE